MDKTTKKKLKIVIIIFVIIMIPGTYYLKIMYAVQIHDRVIDNVYMKESNDYKKTIKNGIEELERAKWYWKSNYLLYYDQARLYCMLKDYKNALVPLFEYERIEPESNKMYFLKGLLYDVLGNRDSAIFYYKILFPKKISKTPDNNEIFGLSHFMFLIYGKDSAINYLSKIHTDGMFDSTMVNSTKLKYDTISHKDYAIDNLP